MMHMSFQIILEQDTWWCSQSLSHSSENSNVVSLAILFPIDCLEWRVRILITCGSTLRSLSDTVTGRNTSTEWIASLVDALVNHLDTRNSSTVEAMFPNVPPTLLALSALLLIRFIKNVANALSSSSHPAINPCFSVSFSTPIPWKRENPPIVKLLLMLGTHAEIGRDVLALMNSLPTSTHSMLFFYLHTM